MSQPSIKARGRPKKYTTITDETPNYIKYRINNTIRYHKPEYQLKRIQLKIKKKRSEIIELENEKKAILQNLPISEIVVPINVPVNSVVEE